MASQDLWTTLHIVLGRLTDYNLVNIVNSFKDPHGAVPPELRVGPLGPFPSRVAELIKALSGDQFPSFQELLKIFCGGNLSQTCSFCSTRMDVAAVSGELEGCLVGIPSVSILPFQPCPLFSCGSETCYAEIVGKLNALGQLSMGLGATQARLVPSRCDYCFMLAEKVHRYE